MPKLMRITTHVWSQSIHHYISYNPDRVPKHTHAHGSGHMVCAYLGKQIPMKSRDVWWVRRAWVFARSNGLSCTGVQIARHWGYGPMRYGVDVVTTLEAVEWYTRMVNLAISKYDVPDAVACSPVHRRV